jgi:sulfide:quinone oxidoreductase
MTFKKISPELSVYEQLSLADLENAASKGFKAIINNRPDGEEAGQVPSATLEAKAKELGLVYRHIPIKPGNADDDAVSAFRSALHDLPAPIVAFCRTGTRSTTLWALSRADQLSVDAILSTASDAGYDLSGLKGRMHEIAQKKTLLKSANEAAPKQYDIVIIGGGAGGIAVASGLLKRDPAYSIAIVEPRDKHYYQPGWTLVGGGVFDRRQTERPMADVMPKGVSWLRSAVAEFMPDQNEIALETGEKIAYQTLVVSPGLKLDWQAIDGLEDALGQRGVTSNYCFDLAPYTWQLTQSMHEGRALFTQPPMPIKCAGAPQKAMYLSCDYWKRNKRLDSIEVDFHNAGGVLFGVKDYVPSLMNYIRDYGINLQLNETLVAINADQKKATFRLENGETITKPFDMIHVCPPQIAPDFIRQSDLADENGWVDVKHETLQHARYPNIFSLGDVCSAPNAKTAAAIRKQAPVVAENILSVMKGKSPRAIYSGYGSCPLTVEKGKIVLAEFGYGGKLEPTIPNWLLDGRKPTKAAWFLKEKMLPAIYFDLMLKGREWLAKPMMLPHDPTSFECVTSFNNEGK